MTTARTREANAEEIAAFRRWEEAVKKGRRSIQAAIAGASVLSYCERFRRDRVPFLAPLWTEDEGKSLDKILDAWNRIERILAAVQKRQLAIRLTPTGDLDVVQTDPDGPDARAFGILPVVAVIVVVAIVGSVISLVAGLDYMAKQKANDYNAARANFAAQMAQQPPQIQQAYADLMKSQPVADDASYLNKFLGTVKSVAPIALVALGLFLLAPLLSKGFGAAKAARRRIAEEEEPARPFENPCGGAGRTPDQWRVSWSRDPRKAQRQLDYVIGSATKKDLSGWADWFSYGSEDADEVPF